MDYCPLHGRTDHTTGGCVLCHGLPPVIVTTGTTAPDPRDAEIERLREEVERLVAELRRREADLDAMWRDRDAARAEVERLVGLLHPPRSPDAKRCPHGSQMGARWECHWCAIKLYVDARAEAERLRPHVRHAPACDYWQKEEARCSCGLTAALLGGG